MNVETLAVLIIGIFIMFIGFLVLRNKALFLVNLVLWNGVSGDEELLSRIFGTILLVVGLIVSLLPIFLS